MTFFGATSSVMNFEYLTKIKMGPKGIKNLILRNPLRHYLIDNFWNSPQQSPAASPTFREAQLFCQVAHLRVTMTNSSLVAATASENEQMYAVHDRLKVDSEDIQINRSLTGFGCRQQLQFLRQDVIRRCSDLTFRHVVTMKDLAELAVNSSLFAVAAYLMGPTCQLHQQMLTEIFTAAAGLYRRYSLVRKVSVLIQKKAVNSYFAGFTPCTGLCYAER